MNFDWEFQIWAQLIYRWPYVGSFFDNQGILKAEADEK